jgi:hypothetical protein
MGKREPVTLPPSATGRRGLVDPVPPDPRGLRGPTPKEARGRNWRRTSRGLYVPAEVDGSLPEQRIVEAAAVLPAYGGVTGWAALRWMGAQWFGGLAPDGTTVLPVSLATAGDDIRPRTGIQVSAERLNPTELIVVDGLRVTTAARSVCFEMRYAASVRGAVVVADMAMQADLVSPSELPAFVAGLSGWTGVPRCRAAMPLTSENSWSPRETSHLRLVWVLDAGFPTPLCNVPIFDRRGRHIGTPDILDAEAGVVGEYDGSVHLLRAQRARAYAVRRRSGRSGSSTSRSSRRMPGTAPASYGACWPCGGGPGTRHQGLEPGPSTSRRGGSPRRRSTNAEH